MKTYFTTRFTRSTLVLLLCSIFCAGAMVLIPKTMLAASAISASYAKAHGSKLSIEVITGPNPPASAILIQRFPAGITMLNSRPSASNYNPQTNTAKWLLRDLRPGKSTVSITLNRPVSSSEISAELRFKPLGGKMTTIRIGN